MKANKKCSQCNFVAVSPSALKNHIKAIHDKIKDEKCPHCDNVFSRKGNLTRHIQRVHLKIWIKMLEDSNHEED